MEKNLTVKKLSMIGIMAAVVYVTSAFIQIPIPTGIDNTRLHVGNVMCLLSGLLLGPVSGGVAAGIGSMFFDLTNPAYITSAPFTFVFKFLMAWICGMIALSSKIPLKETKRNILAAFCGAFAYVLLYIGKSYIEQRFFLQMSWEAVLPVISLKATVSSINAVVSAVAVVPLWMALRAALHRARLL